MQKPLDFAPVSAVPVGGFVKVLSGYLCCIRGAWYYQEGDNKPMQYLCSLKGHPDSGDFWQDGDGNWYYQLNDCAPVEYIGPVDGRAIVI